MKSTFIALAVLLLLLLLFGSKLLDERTEIAAERNDIDARWARLDTDMKQRATGLSALLQMAKAQSGQPDEAAIADVTNARTALLKAITKQDEIGANNRLDDFISRLILLEKSSPRVRDKANVVALEDELAREENQIAVDRRDYNAAITKYNTDIELFPKNVAAAIFGFRHDNSYFVTTRKDQKSAPVKF